MPSSMRRTNSLMSTYSLRMPRYCWKKLIVDDRAGDTHGHGTHRQVGFALHRATASPAFANQAAYPSHRPESSYRPHPARLCRRCRMREAFLSMSGQHRRQINRTWTLRSIKAPNSFRNRRIHIHRLCPVAPARGYGDRNPDIFTCELAPRMPLLPPRRRSQVSAMTHSTGEPSG